MSVKKYLSGIRREIIKFLEENGRSPILRIASELKMSHTGVKKHLDKLVESGVVKVKALLDPKKLRLKLVLILIEAESSKVIRELASKYEECPRIVFLATLIGGYNILAIVIAESMEVVESVVSVCALRTLRGIRRSEVMLVSDLLYPKHLPIRIVKRRDREKPPCGFDCVSCSRFIDGKCLGCPLIKAYKGSL